MLGSGPISAAPLASSLSTNVEVLVTGVSAITAVGSVLVNYVLAPTPPFLRGEVGFVTVEEAISAPAAMVGKIGAVFVWDFNPVAPGINYVPVDPTSVAPWTTETPSQVHNYVTVAPNPNKQYSDVTPNPNASWSETLL